MHDIRAIRENRDAFDAAMRRRGLWDPAKGDLAPSEFGLRVDEARRAAIKLAEDAKAQMNALSKQAGAAKAAGNDEEFESIRAGIAKRKAQISDLEAQAKDEDERLRQYLMGLPNAPLPDIPEGEDETGNVEIRRRGTPRAFDFTPLEHF